MSKICTSVFAIFFVVLVSPLQAEEVAIEFKGLDLLANLEIAVDKPLKRHGVIVLVHDVLDHGRNALMASLQQALKLRGINSLSITISLSLDRRQGLYDCSLEHDHRPSDAVEEIGAWTGWLRSQGVKNINLAGQGRGANHVALYSLRRTSKSQVPAKRIVLIAPAIVTIEDEAAHYRRRYKASLTPRLEKARELVTAGEGHTLLQGIDFLHCQGTRVTAGAFAAYYPPQTVRLTPELLSKSHHPVLVILAGADPASARLHSHLTNAAAPAQKRIMEISQIAGVSSPFRPPNSLSLAEKIYTFMAPKR